MVLFELWWFGCACGLVLRARARACAAPEVVPQGERRRAWVGVGCGLADRRHSQPCSYMLPPRWPTHQHFTPPPPSPFPPQAACTAPTLSARARAAPYWPGPWGPLSFAPSWMLQVKGTVSELVSSLEVGCGALGPAGARAAARCVHTSTTSSLRGAGLCVCVFVCVSGGGGWGVGGVCATGSTSSCP